MEPRNVFKVIVATIGLLGVGYGLLYFVDGILEAADLGSKAGLARYYLGRGIIEIALGLAFMRGASTLAGLAFPGHETPMLQGLPGDGTAEGDA
ncbi:MAG TPA: hypothetical protein VHI13_18790 [Candidatus Kapabacteria bacterium]|nr:hypothetical protein [Candidatus Kapabacteria bacterium]